jgi:hypothetical protein
MKPRHGEIQFLMSGKDARKQLELGYMWVDMPKEFMDSEDTVKAFDFEGFSRGHMAFLRPMTPYEVEMWEANVPEEKRKVHPCNATLVTHIAPGVRQRLFVKAGQVTKFS